MNWAISGAEAWGIWAFRGLLASALIMLAAWIVLRVTRQRIPARTAHTIGLLALVPLVIPQLPGWAWQLQVPAVLHSTPAQAVATEAAARNAVPRRHEAVASMSFSSQPTQQASSREPQALAANPSVESESTASLSPSVQSSFERVELLAALLIIWLAGSLLHAYRLFTSWNRTRKAISASQELPDALRDRVHALIPELEQTRIEVREATDIGGPAAWGLMRKFIVLPSRLAHEMDDAQLRWAVRHELAHHQRGDLWTLLGLQLLRVLWWFHPLLLHWYRMLELERECACDHHAIDHNESPKAAAQALVLAASHALSPAPHSPRLLTQLQTDHDIMKTRITHLLRKPAPSRLGSISPVLCTLLALGGFTLSQSELRIAQDPVALEKAESATAHPDLQRLGRAQNFLIEQQSLGGNWWPVSPRDEYVGEFSSTGVTALAMLALAEAGDGVDDIARRISLSQAKKYLHSAFDHDRGRFRSKSNGRELADHAMAIRALLAINADQEDESYQLLKSAILTLENARNPYSGWRFDLTAVGDNDSFMTSLALVTLEEARAAGFEVDSRAFESGKLYLNELRDEDSGRMAYQSDRPHDPRLYDKGDDYPVKYTELCTAISSIALAQEESDLTDNEGLLQGLVLVASRPPVWRMSNGSVDYYYWMFGSESMRLLGGRLEQQWLKKLRTALADHQRSDGSWPAVDAWSSPGSEVHATACAAIAWRNSMVAQAEGETN